MKSSGIPVSKGILEPSVIIKQGPIKGTERKWNMNKFLAKKVASQAKVRKNEQLAKRARTEAELTDQAKALAEKEHAKKVLDRKMSNFLEDTKLRKRRLEGKRPPKEGWEAALAAVADHPHPDEIAAFQEQDKADLDALLESAAALGIDLTDLNDEYAQKVLKGQKEGAV